MLHGRGLATAICAWPGNFTRGTLDYQTWIIGVLLGSVFILVGLGVIVAVLQESPSERWWALLGVVFAGAYFAWSWNRVRVAQAVLRVLGPQATVAGNGPSRAVPTMSAAMSVSARPDCPRLRPKRRRHDSVDFRG